MEKPKKLKKTAWIFPGGAARAVYTAGNLYALSELGIKPNILIACSGSAPTSICLVTGQKEVIKKVWLESLSTRRFVNFWRFWRIVDVHYLIDEVVRKQNPLDMAALADSPVLTVFPITNTRTGKIEYFSNKDDVDFWQVIKACVSVPICTNAFSIKGNKVGDDYYSDSPGTTRFAQHVSKALDLGAEKIIVFDNWLPADNKISFFFSKILAYLGNANYRKEILNQIREIKEFTPPSGVEFVKFYPRGSLMMNRFEIDNATARRVFQQGYDDLVSNKNYLLSLN